MLRLRHFLLFLILFVSGSITKFLQLLHAVPAGLYADALNYINELLVS